MLRPLLSMVPKAGMNNVIVTHGFNVQSITHFKPAEGESVIFRPLGDGKFAMIARVKASQWKGLSQ